MNNRTFDGDDYVEARDRSRLQTQLDVIRDYMRGAGPKTLERISKDTGFPSASVSAQLRNLRKEAHGGHIVTRKYIGGGIYTYTLTS